MSKKLAIIIFSATFVFYSTLACAGFQNTGPVASNTLDITMDNGVTYFYGGFTTVGSCLYNRLELRETGDYYNRPQNAQRMFALILTAKLQAKSITLTYNDADGPACRVTSVSIGW